MKRLLVTGASGLLGLNLALAACDQGYTVTGIVHEHRLKGTPFEVRVCDLAQPGEITRLIEKVDPDVIVHCAAMVNLEAAEANPQLAQRLNAELPGQLAAAAAAHSIRFAHISTDAVFDGVRGGYGEDDMPNPLSVYGRSKLAGEQAVSAADPSALITRVNFYGWSLSGRRSLAEWFFNNLTDHHPVNGFTDVYCCTLLVNDLAALLLNMISRGLSGIYHAVSRECTSKYAFGVALARQFKLDESLISPVSVSNSNLVARRSLNLALRTVKLTHMLGDVLPNQTECLQRFYQLYQQGYPARLQSYAQES